MPKSVSELMEKPKSLMKAKVPISETGMVTAGMMVARQSSRKRKMTAMTMKIAAQRDQHFADGVADHGCRVEGDGVFQARAESSLTALQRGLGLALSTSRALAFDSCSTPMPIRLMPGVFQRML
jgi:hypothetical protein